jgi:hypothetical protein
MASGKGFSGFRSWRGPLRDRFFGTIASSESQNALDQRVLTFVEERVPWSLLSYFLEFQIQPV